MYKTVECKKTPRKVFQTEDKFVLYALEGVFSYIFAGDFLVISAF